MDAVMLLDRARAAGLAVRAEGGTLIVRGPKSAEPLVHELGAHKEEILRLLASERPPTPSPPPPTPSCPRCGGLTHDALDHLPGIVVLLCDDGERCRWAKAMTAREFAEYAGRRADKAP